MKNKILIAAFAAAVCASASFGEGIFLGIEGDYSFKASLTTKWSDEDDSGTNRYSKAQPALDFKSSYNFGIAKAAGQFWQRGNIR